MMGRKSVHLYGVPYRQGMPNPPITMKGEVVKSYGERDLADYLSSRGIDYTYEERYPIRANYHPDFHVDDTNVWIEYWGLGHDGNVPTWFESRHGLDPSVEYRESMEWKRKVHQRNGTELIEIYAWQRDAGCMKKILRSELKEKGIRGSIFKGLKNRINNPRRRITS